MQRIYFNTALISILATILMAGCLYGQETVPNFQLEPKVKSVVIKNDRTEYVGYILKRDAREILMDVEGLGEIYIPMHEIKSISELGPDEEYTGGEIFATRYFFTTNGLSLKKGDRYALFNWWGPEVHANVTDNVSMGVMTTWIAVPLIGSLKASIPLADQFSLGAGTLFGSGLWAGLGNLGALVYGSATIGDYVNNLTVSGGWLGVTVAGENASTPLMSMAFMFRVSQNFSIVGDSFIVLKQGSGGALIIPGLRYSKANTRAFQFGFAGIVGAEEVGPIPIPYFGFFRAF